MYSAESKVLLVEDDELVRQLLARLLSDSGFVVEEADNGASALHAARRLDGSLSLIITDINMPVMDGLEFARTLRMTDSKVPFLFVTAVDPTMVTSVRPPAHLLVKPFTPEEFLEAVTELVTRSADPGQLA
jgi:DNA-binding response OmpR family regulator